MNAPTEALFFHIPTIPRKQRNKARERSPSPASSDDDHPPIPTWSPINHRTHAVSPGALLPGERAPPDTTDPFHRPPNTRVGRQTKRPAQILAAHNLVPPPALAWSLRRKHLGVVTAILHRSILDSDWPRAERAYACLIRGRDVDIRRVWGLGLDLLLHRGSTRGLKDALEYLERLALFFPFRPKNHSQHPALAVPGEVGNKKKKAVKRKEGAPARHPPAQSAIEFNPALFSLLIEGSRYCEVGNPRAAEEELAATRPEKVRERLEELMLTPPWSDMPSLVCLRGMVCLWMADVELEKNLDGEGDEDMGVGVGDEREVRRRRAAELRKEARGFFEIVKEKGGTLPDGIEDSLAVDEYEDEEMADV